MCRKWKDVLIVAASVSISFCSCTPRGIDTDGLQFALPTVTVYRVMLYFNWVDMYGGTMGDDSAAVPNESDPSVKQKAPRGNMPLTNAMGLCLFDQVDLALKDDGVLWFHDFDGGQMF